MSAERRNKQTKANQNDSSKAKHQNGGRDSAPGALPYRITVEGSDNESAFSYEPISQLTRFASSRGGPGGGATFKNSASLDARQFLHKRRQKIPAYFRLPSQLCLL
jgi:hypothetical protein